MYMQIKLRPKACKEKHGNETTTQFESGPGSNYSGDPECDSDPQVGGGNPSRNGGRTSGWCRGLDWGSVEPLGDDKPSDDHPRTLLETDYLGERKLLASLVARAVIDLRLDIRSPHTFLLVSFHYRPDQKAARIKRTAIEWVMDASMEPWGSKWCLEMLGIPHQYPALVHEVISAIDKSPQDFKGIWASMVRDRASRLLADSPDYKLTPSGQPSTRRSRPRS